MRRKRDLPQTLSPREQRVLDAFFCGHLSAGQLSEALADVRGRPVARPSAAPVAMAGDPQRTVEADLALQLAA